jgi:hypothetical protein
LPERHSIRTRPTWLDAPPSEWPDAARRFFDLCATAAERKLNRERDHRGDDPQ